ncbi:MAG: hypothetical protein JSS53_10010 [Proteobacteria bacterium]|nr:hypothetical protein [Pseudomonadota bacterium]
MISVVVKYFLNESGIQYFPAWYEEVYAEVSKQDGFIKINYEFDEKKVSPKITLYFESIEKLTAWSKTESHDLLKSKIEAHYLKDEENGIEEVSA